MRRVAQIRCELLRLAEAKGKLQRKLECCKPFELPIIDSAIEAVNRKMADVGHELQDLHDRSLAVCP